ncbi:hypothetical protein C5Z25_12010 [Lactobacillus sp. CBA3605]|uniref:hypothetical protein n=1 Tax=Lactobacillus sp. CBA3605 TaxID=2099788 RepID=UPI000CFD064F|nr:hypothetical protein [Lactobacillus sp. CBA3605]AVK62438.1 hypothetical protein C5Z25_12010 [Lactobacillus sp. CBA3605]
MIGELAFIIAIIVSIIFIFSKKSWWGWILIILGALVLITSFSSIPTLVASILFILLGIYGTQRFKIPFLKDTKLIRGLMIFVFLAVVGGTTVAVNKIDQQHRDAKIEKSVKKELANLRLDTPISQYESVRDEIYTIDDSKTRQSLMATYNSKKENYDSSATTNTNDDSPSSSKNDTVNISGNASNVISALSKEKPAASKYIKSINTDSKLGLVVTTTGFNIKNQSQTQKMIGNIENIMKVIHNTDSSKGIGFIQKEASGDTLFAIYFKSDNVNNNLAVGTSDFFDNSTSYYVDGSVAGNNHVFTNKQLSKEGPTVNNKTYTNMLMYN